MTHPIIPIPADARVGDIVWFRDGQRKAIDELLHFCVSVPNNRPGFVNRNGTNDNHPKWDCIGFQYTDNRKPPLGVAKIAKPAKPKPDADAEWLRKLLRERRTMNSDAMRRRIRKIAKRLENTK